jgi:hypothetical protein
MFRLGPRPLEVSDCSVDRLGRSSFFPEIKLIIGQETTYLQVVRQLFAKILSYTIPMVGNRHTGLSPVPPPPGLEIHAIAACFHTRGNRPSLRQRLKTSSISPPRVPTRESHRHLVPSFSLLPGWSIDIQ